MQEAGDEAGWQLLRLWGQLDDPYSGLRHHRYRAYDPALGRFLTHDPLELDGEHNPYQYPSDPIGMGDPLGLAGCSPTVVQESSRARAMRTAQQHAGVPRESRGE